MEYIKSKKYVIRPSKKSMVYKIIASDEFDKKKKRAALDNFLKDIPLTFKRWLHYFDYDILDEVLMEEGCVEIEQTIEEPKNEEIEEEINDLGI